MPINHRRYVLAGVVAAVAVFSPIVATLYFRRTELIATLEGLPAEMTVAAFGTETTLEAAEAQAWAITQVQSLAVSLATAAPEPGTD